MKRIFVLAIIAFCLYNGYGYLQQSMNPYNPQVLNATAEAIAAPTFLSETNRYRAAAGLNPLALNYQLHEAAKAKCANMVALNYWNHDAPDGTEPWAFIDAAGYNYRRAGENLAFGQETQEEVVAQWMNSPKHRDNLLEPDFTEVGHAVCESQNYQGQGHQYIVVQMFGVPS